MPLSEEELRLLEQMERALVAEDPKLATTMAGTRIRQHQRRQLILGIVGFVLGVTLLMSGAVLSIIALGVSGFVVMLGAAYVALTALRGGAASAPSTAAPDTGEMGLRVVDGGRSRRSKPGRAPRSGTMMDRFEERWRRRREGGQ